jgi:hypothetical protein
LPSKGKIKSMDLDTNLDWSKTSFKELMFGAKL